MGRGICCWLFIMSRGMAIVLAAVMVALLVLLLSCFETYEKVELHCKFLQVNIYFLCFDDMHMIRLSSLLAFFPLSQPAPTRPRVTEEGCDEIF